MPAWIGGERRKRVVRVECMVVDVRFGVTAGNQGTVKICEDEKEDGLVVMIVVVRVGCYIRLLRPRHWDYEYWDGGEEWLEWR
jgi:hypothetical protein